jgi:hypothetical protein
MMLRRSLCRPLMALLAIAFSALAPPAALACGRVQVETCAEFTSRGVCSEAGTHAHCTTICAPMCAAVLPPASPIGLPQLKAPPILMMAVSNMPLRHTGPEPPPPRMD